MRTKVREIIETVLIVAAAAIVGIITAFVFDSSNEDILAATLGAFVLALALRGWKKTLDRSSPAGVKPHAYCTHCRAEQHKWRTIPEALVGKRYSCEEDATHLAKIYRSDGLAWLKTERWLYDWAANRTPSRWVWPFYGHPDRFVVTKLLLLIAFLWAAGNATNPLLEWAIIISAVALMADTLVVNTSNAFIVPVPFFEPLCFERDEAHA